MNGLGGEGGRPWPLGHGTRPTCATDPRVRDGARAVPAACHLLSVKENPLSVTLCVPPFTFAFLSSRDPDT